jgi:CMP-N,N'-diacetyllegionaminic acid synthase
MKRILITICGRAGSKGFANKNLKTFCGKPLVYYTLSAAQLFIRSRPDYQVDIALNTDSDLLADLVLEKYPEVEYLPRSQELGEDTVPKMAVFQDTLARMEEKKDRYDYVMDLDITSPLRTVEDITSALEQKINRPDLDLIFSVAPARRNPYFNMVRDCGDHVEKVIESPFTARQQAPEIYDLNASIYIFERDFLANNHTGILWDGKIGAFRMMNTGVLDIDSEEDFRLMEIIAGHLYRNYPLFAQVRENIRS